MNLTEKSNTASRWYSKNLTIILTLILFFPLGLFLMWKYGFWKRKTKIITTIALASILVFGFIVSLNSVPTINITNAKSDKVSTDEASYTLTGDVSSVEEVKLSINDKEIPLTKNKFTYNAELSEGDNTIKLIAINKNGSTTKTITIHRTTQAEFVARADAEKLAVARKTEDEKRKQEEERKKQEAEVAKQSQQTTTSTEQKQTTTMATTTTPPTTIHLLWIATDNSLKSRDGVDVKYNEQTKIAELIITRKSDSFWDEKAVIQSGYSSFVKWGKEVAKVSGPETITVTLKTDFKDNYGKDTLQNAVDISMQVADFKKFDWNGLVGSVIAPQLQSSSMNTLGYLVVHPALRSELSNAKLYL